MLAPEGKSILIITLVITALTGIGSTIFQVSLLSWIYPLAGLFFLFTLFFFRDPRRQIPAGDRIIVAPADGKVIKITRLADTQVGEQAQMVSIFLSVFNVHVNRVPCAGKVQSVQYRPGRFLAAFNHKASDENEQTDITLTTAWGTVRIKQIAGLIARRIHCYASEGRYMQTGERLGFIRFGSRTDVILPHQASIVVEVGQKVTGGETIIGEFP